MHTDVVTCKSCGLPPTSISCRQYCCHHLRRNISIFRCTYTVTLLTWQYTWYGHTVPVRISIDVTRGTWRTIHEEVHLSFSSSYQSSFKSIHTRLIDIILRQAILSIDNSSLSEKKYFLNPDIQLAARCLLHPTVAALLCQVTVNL